MSPTATPARTASRMRRLASCRSARRSDLEVLPRQSAEGVLPFEKRGQGGRRFRAGFAGRLRHKGLTASPIPPGSCSHEDIPQADEVDSHVLGPDAERRQDGLRPGDVVAKEGWAGVRHRRSEVRKVIFGVLDALGLPALAVALPQPRLKLVLSGDDRLGQRLALGFRWSGPLLGQGPAWLSLRPFWVCSILGFDRGRNNDRCQSPGAILSDDGITESAGEPKFSAIHERSGQRQQRRPVGVYFARNCAKRTDSHKIRRDSWCQGHRKQF